MIERERTVGSHRSKETQYYWSSHEYGAEEFNSMVRILWSIENELRWCLDVAFREDESRIRTEHGPENIALLRKIAMNLAKNEGSRRRDDAQRWTTTTSSSCFRPASPTNQAN